MPVALHVLTANQMYLDFCQLFSKAYAECLDWFSTFQAAISLYSSYLSLRINLQMHDK